MKRRALAMWGEADEERRSACRKQVECLERMTAQAIRDSLRSGESGPQPLPRSYCRQSQLPPVIIDLRDDNLEDLSARSHQASSVVSPTARTRRPTSWVAFAGTEPTSSSGSNKGAKLRRGRVVDKAIGLQRRARPQTIWRTPAYL